MEKESTGLLGKILPPRLEDAGLEDCALPPDSIQQAFLKAAAAVKSRAGTLFHSDDEEDTSCVDAPWPDEVSDELQDVSPRPERTDKLVLGGSSEPEPGRCVTQKGGDDAAAEDKVVVVGEGEFSGGEGCLIDGLKDSMIKKKEKGKEEEEERKGKKPTLIEELV